MIALKIDTSTQQKKGKKVVQKSVQGFNKFEQITRFIPSLKRYSARTKLLNEVIYVTWLYEHKTSATLSRNQIIAIQERKQFKLLKCKHII